MSTAHGRDESTQREPATNYTNLGGQWLVPAADRPGTGDSPGDGRPASGTGQFKTSHFAHRGFGPGSGGWPAEFVRALGGGHHAGGAGGPVRAAHLSGLGGGP